MVTVNLKTNVISDIIPQCVLTTTAKCLNVKKDILEHPHISKYIGGAHLQHSVYRNIKPAMI